MQGTLHRRRKGRIARVAAQIALQCCGTGRQSHTPQRTGAGDARFRSRSRGLLGRRHRFGLPVHRVVFCSLPAAEALAVAALADLSHRAKVVLILFLPCALTHLADAHARAATGAGAELRGLHVCESQVVGAAA